MAFSTAVVDDDVVDDDLCFYVNIDGNWNWTCPLVPVPKSMNGCCVVLCCIASVTVTNHAFLDSISTVRAIDFLLL